MPHNLRFILKSGPPRLKRFNTKNKFYVQKAAEKRKKNIIQKW